VRSGQSQSGGRIRRTPLRRCYASFSYRAGSWTKPRRVVAKVEWHPGELYPRAGFLVTNMARPAENVIAFYNKRGRCEQWIKEGKGAIKWTRLSCRSFAANAVRLQLHTLAYNLGNFLRTLATPEPIKDWSLTSLKEKLIKIGAKIVSHGRYVAFRWRKLPFRETCSPTSCGSSRNCGHRLMRRPRKGLDRHPCPTRGRGAS
jgi:Transposase DDE domain group 1